MKRITVSLCFIISMVMCVGLIAQNNDTIVEKSTENLPPPVEPELNHIIYDVDSVAPFVGVWALVRMAVDNVGQTRVVYTGHYMVVDSSGKYTIFVGNMSGAVITSEGYILVESPSVYIEQIDRSMNRYLNGRSNRIDYKLENDCLQKSFFIEKDDLDGHHSRQEQETWRRVSMPQVTYQQ